MNDTFNVIEQNMENAIFFTIDDSYCFAFANVLMSMKENSASIFETTDIICYNSGISDKNKELLKSIHRDIIFEEIVLPDTFSVMLDNPRVQKWGIYVLVKFFGFKLVQKYKKVLHLDADIFISGDLGKFFELDVDMAWRKVRAWNPTEILMKCFDEEPTYVSAPNGGVVYFTDRVNRFNINEKTILNAFEKIKNCRTGGIDELVFAYLSHTLNMQIKELPFIYNDTLYTGDKYVSERDTIVIHFLDILGDVTKPWKSLASYLYVEEWRKNNDAWVESGGTSPINFNKEDYYNLLFEKTIKIDKLKNDKKKMISEIEHRIADANEATNAKMVALKNVEELTRTLDNKNLELAQNKANVDVLTKECATARIDIETLAQELKDMELKFARNKASVDVLANECDAAKTYIQKLTKELDKKSKELEQQKAKHTKKIQIKEKEILKIRKELNDLKIGFSFRLGRVITWLPRKIMGRK